MPEPFFLLLLMILTGLGVWTFLGQLHSGRLSLPRLRLGLPKLPARRVKRSRRARQPRDDQAFDVYDAGRFDPNRSPFAGPVTIPVYAPPPVYEQPSTDDDIDDLPANQVDFFADDRGAHSAAPLHTVSLAPSPAPVLDPDLPSLTVDPAPRKEDGTLPLDQATAQPSPVFEVAVSEPDPNDIMSFFEKPNAISQMPETLRESLETVAAADLLAEARQLRSLIQGRRDTA
jgi:hypothetical protein